MADGHRVYPVNKVVLHHSVGPEFPNASDVEISAWFSMVGRTRGYANVAHSYHYDPYTGKETFSQAHYALHAYTLDKNKYGWRMTLLIKDPWNNVAWHAGNWPVNQTSIGIETCGNYVNKYLPDKALMLIADTFREQDAKLGGWLSYHVHKEYQATACPGKIAEQIDKLYDMANNKAKWDEKLWPSSTDNLYRVIKAGKQIGAYAVRDNAFDKWYLEKADKVTYKGSDITSQFKTEMNILEKKVADLESKVSSLTASNKALTESNTQLKATITTLNEQVKELTAGQASCETSLETAKKALETCVTEGQNCKDSVQKLTEDYQALNQEYQELLETCSWDEPDSIQEWIAAFLAWLQKPRTKAPATPTEETPTEAPQPE